GLRSNKVHLHDDGHGPGKTLIDTEQCVRGHHPAPGGAPADHERNWKPEEPARDEQVLASIKVGQMPGEEVGEGLHDSEADDERDTECPEAAERRIDDAGQAAAVHEITTGWAARGRVTRTGLLRRETCVHGS